MTRMAERLIDWLAAVMAVVVLFGLFSLLAGCAEMNAFRAGIASHGATAMDQVMTDSKWAVCQAVSIGALERELGGDPERIAGWILFCNKKAKTSPLLHKLEPTPPAVIPQGGIPSEQTKMKRASHELEG